jgi:signal transduction histidine kinase
MISPEIPINETKRLKKLYSYQIYDTPSESDYDELVQLASQICNVPISLITLVDKHRQWFKASVGLQVSETTREVSFCGHAINENNLFIVENASKDKRFLNNPFVTSKPDIKFYMGMPLTTPDGYNIGTLCVIDHKPRILTEEQKIAIKILSKQVVNHLELRKQINEIKNAYVDLFEERENSQRISKIYQKILSIVGHDIRGPLNTFTQLVELLMDGKVSYDDFLKLAPSFKKNMQNTTTLLDNLVDWGREYIKGNNYNFSDINFYHIVEKVKCNFVTQANIKGIKIINKVSNGLVVYFDENILHFIIRNLVSNALKFTQTGKIEIEANVTGSHLIFSISDTGIGMSEKIKNDLFKWGITKNSRLGTNNEKGTGLGLSIIKEFIDQLNADIHVDTEINKGTKFTITIPLQKNL